MKRKRHPVAGLLFFIAGAPAPASHAAPAAAPRATAAPPAQGAQAARDIVYSARYYLRPGSRGKSRFHLYRINPDGSGRKQLTSGTNDDQHPLWSPDGRQIAFVRSSASGRAQLSIVGENGGRVRNVMALDDRWSWLRWTPDGRNLCGVHEDWSTPQGGSAFHVFDLKGKTLFRSYGARSYDWSPSGKYLALHRGDGKRGASIIDWKTRRSVKVQGPAQGMSWRDDQTLLGIEHNGDRGGAFVREYDTAGKLRRRLPMNFSGATPESEPDARSRLKRVPGRGSPMLFVCDESTSTGQEYTYLRFVPGRPSLALLARGTSLSFSADGSRYAMVAYHELANFDKRNGGRVVWVAPLQVGATAGARPKSIVSGMVYVTGCDWRGRTPP